MTGDGPTGTDFDAYAAHYDGALAEGLAVSGEGKLFFARGRIAWLRRCLGAMREAPKAVLDFGCGTGTSAPLLLTLIGAERLVGVDTSVESLAAARHACDSPRARFLRFVDYEPRAELDLAFCNGVFHHIPPAERAGAIAYVFRALRPGGLFALWENNPWNPGARYVMRRIPFDRNAITLTPPETRRLLRRSGFDIVRTDFLFVFPRMLRWLRGAEPWVSRLPLGAQYQVLARKPRAA